MNPQKHAECSSSQGTQTDSNPSPFICQVGEAGRGERQAREGWGAGPGARGWHAKCSAGHCLFRHMRLKLKLVPRVIRLPKRAGRELLRPSPTLSAR